MLYLGIHTKLVAPTVFWKEYSTSNTSTSAQNIQDVSVNTESIAGSFKFTTSKTLNEDAYCKYTYMVNGMP